MKLIASACSAVFLFAGFSVCAAQPPDVRLKLRSDEVALRRIVVTLKSGKRLSAIDTIDSFDDSSGQFVIKDVTGLKTNVLASDIQKIEFEQEVKRQSPAAQSGPWEIRTTLGSKSRYKVPQASLRIESGELVLPESSAPADRSGSPAFAPEPGAQHGGSVTHQKLAEAKSLTFDAPSQSFVMDVQNVTYTTERWGSGGLSGLRK